jgi:hypothetical protein
MNKKNRRPTARSAAASSAPAEFNPDYTQVKKDLARIGILSAVFFVLLIALTFIIK